MARVSNVRLLSGHFPVALETGAAVWHIIAKDRLYAATWRSKMSKGIVQVYYGTGKGKTSAAVGQCIRAAGQGLSVIIIQFLKGKEADEFNFLGKLEPEIKLFRFEKADRSYDLLLASQQKEEKQNILNGFNFAKKVIDTGECDVLVLDEVLALPDLGIITVDDIISLTSMREDYCRIVLTGRNLPRELLPYADVVSKIDLEKDDTV